MANDHQGNRPQTTVDEGHKLGTVFSRACLPMLGYNYLNEYVDSSSRSSYEGSS